MAAVSPYGAPGASDGVIASSNPLFSEWASNPAYRVRLLRHPFSPGVFSFFSDSGFVDELRRFGLSQSALVPVGLGGPLSEIELSDVDVKLWRGGRSVGVSSRGKAEFAMFGRKWGGALCAFLQRIPPEAKAQCFEVLAGADTVSETRFIAYLKGVSVLASRRNLSSGPGWWTFLCDLHVLGGYDTVLNRVDVLRDYHLVAGSARPSILDARLKSLIRSTVRLLRFDPGKAIGFDDFIRFRDAWALPGACTHGTPALLQVRGRVRRVRGKFASLLGWTDAEIAAAARRGDPARIYPFRKLDEPAKTRVVQSYDVFSYLRCSYLDAMIGDYNGSEVWTTLGMNSSQRAELSASIFGLLQQPGTSAVSIDQSAFDEAQSKDAVAFVLSELFDAAASSLPPAVAAEVRALGKAEAASFAQAKVWDKSSGVPVPLFPWKQGVPSGHKFTGLIDSILNRAETLWAAEQLGVVVHKGIWQGDDCGLIIQGSSTPDVWASTLARKGLTANPLKTGCSPSRLEFLHEVLGPEGVWALPARAFRTVIWRPPDMGSSSFTPRHEQVSALWDTMLKCQRRGMSMLPCIRRSFDALFPKGTPRPPSTMRDEWICTPRVFGGFGLGLKGRVSGEWEPSKVKWRGIKIVSKIAMSGPRKAVESAAVRRLGVATPLPSVPASFSLRRVRPPPVTPPMPRLKRPLRYDWVVYDTRHRQDAWTQKLRLEHALSGGDEITLDMLPDRSLAISPLGVDAAVRILSKWAGWSPCFEMATSSGLPFSFAREYGASAWSAWLARWVLGGRRPTDGLSNSPVSPDDFILILSSFCFKNVVFGRVGLRTAV